MSRPTKPKPKQFAIAKTPFSAIPIPITNLTALHEFMENHSCKCCTAGAIIPPDLQSEPDCTDYIRSSEVSLYAIVSGSDAPLGVLGYMPNPTNGCAALKVHLHGGIGEENVKLVVAAASAHGLYTLRYQRLTCVVRKDSPLRKIHNRCGFVFDGPRGEYQIWSCERRI